jgi:hypothetical protein
VRVATFANIHISSEQDSGETTRFKGRGMGRRLGTESCRPGWLDPSKSFMKILPAQTSISDRETPVDIVRQGTTKFEQNSKKFSFFTCATLCGDHHILVY